VNAEPTWLSTGAHEARAGRTASAWLVALLAHGALSALALNTEPPTPPLVTVTEVELLAPPPPVTPPVAPPPEPPPPAAVAPRPERRAAERRAPQRAPAPPPASAAPLRTVDEAVKTADEPVRFVTDPNGRAFGYGAVQRGGTAASAPVGAAAAGDRPAAPTATGSANPILSRAPRLGESDPCRGFFPSRAQVDRGEVLLRVKVEADGTVRSVVVSREVPEGHGFGFAARDCLLSKQFTPALDQGGREVSVVSPVTVRFSR